MTIVFESIAGLNNGEVRGLFAPTQGVASDVNPQNSVIGRFRPFTALHDGSQPAQVAGVFPPSRGLASDFLTSGVIGAFDVARAYATEANITPLVSLVVGGFAPARGQIIAELLNEGTVAGKFAPVRGLGTNLNLPLVRGYCAPTTGLALSEINYVGGVSLMIGPLYVFGEGELAYPRLIERIGIKPTLDSQPVWALFERLALSGDTSSLLHGFNTLRDTVALEDQLQVIFRMLLTENLGVGESHALSYQAIESIAEAVSLLAGVGSVVSVYNAIAVVLALDDTLRFVAKEGITEQAAFNAALASALEARDTFVAAIGFDAALTPEARIAGVLEESLALSLTGTSVLSAFETLRENIEFLVTLRIKDTVYAAWVCNTDSKSFVSYVNYPFNSFADDPADPQRYFGMCEDGIYELDGDDDAGTAIESRVRMGLNNLGNQRLKRVPGIYFGVTATGQIVIKVSTQDEKGVREESWYELVPKDGGRGAGAQEGRVKFGRGLRSIYWDFELVSRHRYEIQSVQLMPMNLERRIRGAGNEA
jgi:hypothetical protein